MLQPVSHSSAPAAGSLVFRRSALVCALAAVLGVPAAAQGETGYLRGKGRTDIAPSYTLDTYDRFWLGSDDVSDPGVGTVDRETYGLYIAYGVTDEMDLIVSGAYVEASSDGIAGAPDESDLQDMLIATKFRVLRHETSWGEMSVCALPGVQFPMSDYENNAITAIGDGNVDWRARFVGQIQTHRGLFAALETGYDFRVGDPPDAVPINLTLGGTIANRVTVSPFLSIVDSLWGTDIGEGSFPTNEEDYTRTGLSAFVRITENIGLTGTWRTTLDGRNTGDVDGLSVGFVASI